MHAAPSSCTSFKRYDGAKRAFLESEHLSLRAVIENALSLVTGLAWTASSGT